MERERRTLAFGLLLPLKAPCTPPTRPACPRCQPPLPVPQRAAGPPRRPPPPQPPHTSRPPPPSPRPLHTPQTNHAQISRREGNAAQRREKRTSDALHTDNIIHTCGGRGSPVARGVAPQLWTAHPRGAVPKYPDPGQQGNDLSRSRGDWIRSGAGLFPSGFPSPPTTGLNFSLWRDLSVWRIWGGYFGHRRSVWEGFIDSGDAVPVAV